MSYPLRCDSQVALVTGAAVGIGREHSLLLPLAGVQDKPRSLGCGVF